MRTFVISTMAGGGAARALANLANHFAARGDEVGIVTLHGGADGYALHPKIRRRDLGFRRGVVPSCSAESLQAMRALTARFPQTPQLAADAPSMAALSDAFVEERSHVVVGIGDVTAVRVILAARGLGIRAIAWEQCDPLALGTWRAAQKLVYPLADAVVMLMPQHTWAYRGAMAIGNAAMAAPARVRPRTEMRRVVGIGRLAIEKGFDLLIAAFARIAERNPEWRLEIYGEGSMRAALQAQIFRHGLHRRVSLPGQSRDVWSVLARADLFVLPSYTEGFGIALAEAMAAGVAPIVVDCGAASRTIVRDGVDGVRVPRTANALAGAMERLMRDDVHRARLGARAVEIVNRYSIEAIAAQWDKVLDVECAGHAGALTAAAWPPHSTLLARYAADGIVFPLRAIPPEEAERYCGLARAALARDPEVEANPHLKCDWARELATHPAIRAAAAAILGDAAVWASMLLYKPPHSRGFVSWHQDGAYRDFGPGDVASAWIALSEATAENGCMQVVRGSHRARLPHRDVPERDNMIRLGKHAEAAIDPLSVTNVVLQAGEMSIHHNDLLHGSRPNASDRPRLGFVVRFLRRDVPWSGPLV